MKYVGPCIAVDDINQSRDFYENLLDQKVKYNFGENITYEGAFAIQLKPHFAKMININRNEIQDKSNNFEITFETEDLDAFVNKIKNSKYSIVFLHEVIEHSWGQRVIRFYDPSSNVIEVGEDMRIVCLRFLRQGLSIEETAAKTQFPVDFIRICQRDLAQEI